MSSDDVQTTGRPTQTALRARLAADQQAIEGLIEHAVANVSHDLRQDVERQTHRQDARLDNIERLLEAMTRTLATAPADPGNPPMTPVAPTPPPRPSSSRWLTPSTPQTSSSSETPASSMPRPLISPRFPQPTPSDTARAPRVDTSPQPELLSKEHTLLTYRIWRKKYMNIHVVNRFDQRPLAEQHIRLEGCISTDMLKHMKYVVDLSDWSHHTVEDILDTLERHFDEEANLIELCVKFDRCSQSHGETFNDFYVRLRELYDQTDPCTHCPNKACQDKALSTRVISGIVDDDVRRKLLTLHRPSLQEVLRTCRAEDHAQNESDAMAKAGHSDAHINHAQSRGRSNSRDPRQKSDHRVPRSKCTWPRSDSDSRGDKPQGELKPKEESTQCLFCGAKPHKSRSECKALGAICGYCNKTGHFRNMCFALQKDNAAHNIAIHIRHLSSPAAPTIEVTITHGHATFRVTALPDTGADEPLVSWECLAQQGVTLSMLKQTAMRAIVAANGNPLECYGTIYLKLTYGRNATKTTVYTSVQK